MLYRETIAVCSRIHTKHKTRTEFLDVTPGGTSVYLSLKFFPQISGYLAVAAGGLRPPTPGVRRHNRTEPEQRTQRCLLILRGPQFGSRHQQLAVLPSGDELWPARR
jgi:hypothetical protein